MPKKAPRNVLFIHNNFPAQFKLLSRALLDEGSYRVSAIGQFARSSDKRIRVHSYGIDGPAVESVHPFARRFDIDARRAEQVTYAVGSLKAEGRTPDMVFAHPGWGEALPLRTLLPKAAIILYCEFFYRAKGADVGFDPEFAKLGVDSEIRIGLRNASQLLSISDADAGVSPTCWQKSSYPADVRKKITRIHDGIDIDALSNIPDNASQALARFGLLPGSEYITFVSRALEPYRGIHSFMRALPEILKRRPSAHALLIGSEDEPGYGSKHESGSWVKFLREELGDTVPWDRVHFTGTLLYNDYVSILRHSKAHVYLTYPFILSWSLIEAMALGKVIIGSDTAPVLEVIEDGHTGLIAPFFDTEALADRIVDVLAHPRRYEQLGFAAASLARKAYDFRSRSLPRYQELIAELIG